VSAGAPRALGFSVLAAAVGIFLNVCGEAAAPHSNPLPTMPNPRLTPGDTLAVAARDICVPGYTKKVRNVPAAVRMQVYAEYGIANHAPRAFEVDHLISLELGGSNSLRNLWPESYLTAPYNAHVKDRLENRLHEEVCTGRTPLASAQREIATDWIGAYRRRFGVPGMPSARTFHAPYTSRVRSRRTPIVAAGAPLAATPGEVWVNLRSGIYWRPGTRYYGRTREGKYLRESAAKRAGYRAAKGK
jgi:hypothetical protein